MSWFARQRRWLPTPAYSRAIGLPLVLAAAALVLGRVELLLLGLPLALSVALAHGRHSALAREWSRQPGLTSPPNVRVEGPTRVEAGHTTRLATTIHPSDAQLATVLLPPDVQDGDGERIAVSAPARDAEPRPVVTAMEITTWGTHAIARPDHLAATADAYWVAGPFEGEAFTTQVLPAVSSRLPTGPLPPRPAGMVGAHRTRRPGEGTELHEISPFVPGDRLRRVDWRVTARQAGPDEQLYTRRTLVDADADVMCCMDNRFDLSAEVNRWSAVTDAEPADDATQVPRTSIDIAVDTVSSIAAGYLAHGDRVGLLDLSAPTSGRGPGGVPGGTGSRSAMVRPGSGSRHLIRLRSHLASRTHRPSSGDLTPLADKMPPFPPGAIIVVTSVFLDASIVELTAGWRRAGHPVLAVDVMPQPLHVDPGDTATRLALRVVLAERDERFAALTSHGVVVTSADPTRLALDLARLARTPRRSRQR
ncbi:DUF58 domain-containing protein [Actinobacteria bacterium YIM 96077]|uniref:DUF58 domain-containing protein n=1 Tax=Phytoactinopolyspora halophila TaxID=1981511 RepID=A0A329QHU9_9ACTN|nr:DUF58 domain-containing protein [Phytoactinopolyspora halophila]AYY14106.1 DUF58 domain-containing protein [Actinobacteria bacterium YIM 96077]RAW09958.1 hypothetical protein DPM12_19945 [Phytoactinopolyspora halophila]